MASSTAPSLEPDIPWHPSRAQERGGIREGGNAAPKWGWNDESDKPAVTQAWRESERLRQHKQHHVHTLSADGKKRIPLTCCRRRDKPKECKGGFPKDAQVIGAKEAVVVCPGLAKKMKLPTKGRRNALYRACAPIMVES